MRCGQQMWKFTDVYWRNVMETKHEMRKALKNAILLAPVKTWSAVKKVWPVAKLQQRLSPWVFSQLNVCILYFPGKNPSGATSLSLCRFGSTIGERRNGKTVLSNKITRNRIVLHNSNSQIKPLGRRPYNGLVNIQDGHGSSLKVYDDSAVSESGGHCRAFRMTCKVANAT